MPLPHDSLSHGTVAFGFYNVETDGLLLDRLFFFCTDFCAAAIALAGKEGPARTPLAGHAFSDAAAVGDLMGAIHGVRFTGYLGETYRRWPFPSRPEDFRQRLNGDQRRAETEAMLDRHAARTDIGLARDAQDVVSIGPYRFTAPQYRALLHYVRRGGHPTWEGFEDGRMPPHVADMAGACGLAASSGLASSGLASSGLASSSLE